jgi:glycosyltransferase involved in cell wall biosynthesis
MRVGLDARHAARGLGIGNFVANLARELVAFEDLDLVWLGDPALAPPRIRRSVRVDRLPYPLLDGLVGRELAAWLELDVIHFTGNTGWGRPGPVPSVLTLQDLIFLSTDRADHSARQVVGHAYERWLIGRAVRATDVLAVSSETIAADVRARLGQDLSPRVVPYGVAAPPEPAAARERPDDHQPYLIAFAGRDPRKRTEDVVAGWRKLTAEPGSSPAERVDLRLLASAGLPPGLRESLKPELARGSVTILDHVPRDRVWVELSGALALAYPSADEGFGLPVLEGMAAGTPVLTGLAPATREIGGDAIVQLDSDDVAGSIAVAVARLVSDPTGRAELVERGRRRAALFTWTQTAAGYLELYRAAIAERR